MKTTYPTEFTIAEPSKTEFAKASQAFLSTGKIPELLLQCFDQNGIWLGESPASEYVDPAAYEMLEEMSIPEERRSITNDRGESILLTSYIVECSSSHTIPWHEIRGMFRIDTGSDLNAPNLKRLSPYYVSDINALTTSLPELLNVHSMLITTYQLAIPKLEWAVDLTIFYVPILIAEQLETVGILRLNGVKRATFPELRNVHEHLEGSQLWQFVAPKLESVNPCVHTHSHADSDRLTGFILPETTVINAPQLTYVGGLVDTQCAEYFYLPNLIVSWHWYRHPKAKENYSRESSGGSDSL